MRIRIETERAAVGIDDGRITRPDDGAYDFVVDAGVGELRPGLINAHDHLHRNHLPRIGEPPYADAYEWGRDLHERFAAEIERARRIERADALLFGALKNLLGGVTTAVHHDRWEPAFDGPFPIRVPRVRVAHSMRFERDLAAALAGNAATRARPLCIHLAEGVNRAAAAEIDALAGLGFVDRCLLAVHLVGVETGGASRLRRAGAAAVWCPTSNEFLFGRTAPAALFESGIDVLLGTDALLTGAGTMLDELAAARRIGHIGDERLLDAVGRTAARRLGLPAPELSPGSPADLVLMRRPLLEARPADIALVLVGGEPRLGEPDFAMLFERRGVRTETLEVGGTEKLVAAPLGSIASRVTERVPECARILEPTGRRTLVENAP